MAPLSLKNTHIFRFSPDTEFKRLCGIRIIRETHESSETGNRPAGSIDFEERGNEINIADRNRHIFAINVICNDLYL